MARTTKRRTKRKPYKKSKYRTANARQIQPARPRPARSQLVRMTYTNTCFLKPAIVGNVQPANGFRIAVNRPHHLFDATHLTSGATPQETWLIPLDTQGTMPHLSQWRAKYENYLIRGTKITATFRTEGNSNTNDRSGKLCLIRHSNTADITEATTFAKVRDNNQYVQMSHVTPSTTSTNQVRMSMGYNPSRYFAVNKSALSADDTLQGTLATTGDIGPEEDAFISLVYLSPFINATSGEYTMPEGCVDIRIDMLVEFLNPQQNTAQQPST